MSSSWLLWAPLGLLWACSGLLWAPLALHMLSRQRLSRSSVNNNTWVEVFAGMGLHMLSIQRPSRSSVNNTSGLVWARQSRALIEVLAILGTSIAHLERGRCWCGWFPLVIRWLSFLLTGAVIHLRVHSRWFGGNRHPSLGEPEQRMLTPELVSSVVGTPCI